MASSNVTLTNDEVLRLVKDWNFTWSVVFLLITIVLQYGYPSRSMFVYVIKMFVLWLLWPASMALSIFCAVYPIDLASQIISGILAATSCAMWISYFVQSIRLFMRTGSWWSFNPESNCLLNVPIGGTTVVRPLVEDSTSVTAVVTDGYLKMAGMHFGACDFQRLPSEVTVAKPNVLIALKMIKRQAYGTNSGVAIYHRYKAGNYRRPPIIQDQELALLRA
ncbi:membrane glycoprotein [BtPa-BetaCoV/GD2013]|uniref:Membrane protein n=7 Tax=Orthocoronavirinae TaxID=2501931 RepID=A0A6F8IJN5_BCHK5|nr:Membrane glycoprotein [Bat coronavirus HKU5-2]ABN10899.1 Membrane glycoprotein [Bat coronavirus HKU5-3]ABN10908.1 Membrane glycoprotein [Bat coronavirus HKU5-5]AIA62349.1 membrane glycoprotein [BtPa-BetaCoV/GD2013]AWH65916.1 M protein [Pipistrellus bat coronavirus HKU5]QHA24693.1 membrane protein [Pipistrellus abramus bat coronavirus HKU5-related]WCC63303.1 membrane protein [Bat Coronavirus PaGD18]WCC63402.1 membrane protein [Bat Coronavirus PaGD17]